MLTILIGKDWTLNRDEILRLIAQDVKNKLKGRILMVPELVSHDTERRLAAVAGNTASRYAEVLSFTRLVRRVADLQMRPVEECLDDGGRITAILINTSRGGIVDEAALIDALERGNIAGAGLDVFEDESGKLDRRILENKMVTLTPHVAWNTVEAGAALHKEVTENVMRFLGGNRPESVVNGL